MRIDDLATAIEARRDELGITQRQLSEMSGVSLTTISAIERRARDVFQTTTLTSLDRALGWPLGQAGSILRGDQPATSLILTSRVAPTSARLLCDLAAELNEEQVRALVAHAQQLKSGTPDTFHVDGVVRSLQVIRGDTETYSLGVLESGGTRWTITHVVHAQVPDDRDSLAHEGDHMTITYQRMS